MNSSTNGHLSQDLIFRTLDNELTGPEHFECESHLAVCEACRLNLASLSAFSMDVEAAVQSTALPSMGGARQQLKKAVEREQAAALVLQSPAKVMRRFGWGMGIAATLAFGILLAPRTEFSTHSAATETLTPAVPVTQASSIEVDGESFVPVPYSNPDLSTASPHVVQMQVPVSSLADVGIVLEPVTSRVGSAVEMERSVLADVLVGADGQPRGVHVLGLD